MKYLKKPNEYSTFLQYKNNFEKPRNQICGNCWAITLASIIGDKLCIKYNLSPIYPSSIWITTIAAELSKNPKFPDFNYISNGYSCLDVAEAMINNPEKFYVKLENCFNEKQTIIYYADENKVMYNEFRPNFQLICGKLDIKYLGNNPDCCLSSLRKNEDSYYCKDFNIKDRLLNLAKIKVVKINIFKTIYKYKSEYNEEEIIQIQNLLKYFIYCNKVAIVQIFSTYQYKLYKQFFKYDENKIFEQNENYDYTDSRHDIVIFGWGKEDVPPYREFWYVRDTNSIYYKKIAFSRYDNKDYWIGIDVQFKIEDNKDFNEIFSLDSEIDSNSLNELIKNNIIVQN